ncbi:hypothetical protein QBC38DRAFT_240783 [Podospora fimiseda]|uniref:Heterokaryon incompatibility domain-containing protein n=1 Tax=Podospora fimiseda TaxID=252190 RepID=A0AAN7BMI4_9PEZI|nr:hypothetical protein QBC38DRAFT_240783 [Podospora fimiseda]
MRLLNTESFKLHEFISDDSIPRYSILSHTWEAGQEVSYQEWEAYTSPRGDEEVEKKTGFVKIRRFCIEALCDGFQWVWVDTCCIDKKSSAELSEAINAMFRWYQNSAICYVHLADVSWSADMTAVQEQLSKSRWFTRGWTLQELIAPKTVRFYAGDWRFIETKATLRGFISSLTNIDPHILLGGDLETISVARRMSWASKRQTSRAEDLAYCLLGIFDVNLPLIYGEGLKAFRRLQEAIMLKTHDQSLFAWGRLARNFSEVITEDQAFGAQPLPWKPREERLPLLGLFAETPELFQWSKDISPVDHSFSHDLIRSHPPTLISGGVNLGVVIWKSLLTATYFDQPPICSPCNVEIAILVCRVGTSDNKLVGLALRPWGAGYYGRTPELVVINMAVSSMRFHKWVRPRHIMSERSEQLRNGDIVFRRCFTPFKGTVDERGRTKSGPAWRRRDHCGSWILRMADDVVGHEKFRSEYDTGLNQGVALTFQRLSKTMNPIGPLMVEISGFSMGTTVTAAGSSNPTYSYTMKAPCDRWALEVGNLPRIYIKVERKPIGNNGSEGAVDVVDLYMYPDGALAAKAKEIINI